MFFDNIDGANIETNTKDATKSIENTALCPDKTIVPLDVILKRLMKNVLHEENCTAGRGVLSANLRIHNEKGSEYGGQQGTFSV